MGMTNFKVVLFIFKLSGCWCNEAIILWYILFTDCKNLMGLSNKTLLLKEAYVSFCKYLLHTYSLLYHLQQASGVSKITRDLLKSMNSTVVISKSILNAQKISFTLFIFLLQVDTRGYFRRFKNVLHEVQKNSDTHMNILRIQFSVTYLAKSSLSIRTSSSAVHWSDSVVKPQISAKRMLKYLRTINKDWKIKLLFRNSSTHYKQTIQKQ